MLLPLRDLNPSRNTPWVTWMIILVCSLVWVFEAVQPPGGMQAMLQEYALVPARVTQMLANGFDGPTAFSVLASMFMHGGWMHAITNLWVMWIFGDNVEDNMGHGRYAAFYLLCGTAAAAMQWVVDPTSTIPMVGASGAIAGVLAAYMVLYPRARVHTLVMLVVFFHVMELPALIVIGAWIALQLAAVFLSGAGAGGGVAYWAHIGGFLAGLVLVFVMRRPKVPAVAVAGVPGNGRDPRLDERWRYPGAQPPPAQWQQPPPPRSWDRDQGW